MTLTVPSGVLARAQALSSEAGVMAAVLLGCTPAPGQGPSAHTGVEVGSAGWWLHRRDPSLPRHLPDLLGWPTLWPAWASLPR